MTSKTENPKKDGENINPDKFDLKKIEEIQQIQNMIFNVDKQGEKNLESKKFAIEKFSNISSNYKSELNSPAKLPEHGNFIHSFLDYNIRANEVVPLYFLKHHSTDNNFSLSVSLIPVITDIKIKDKDTIELTRVHLYTDFFNSAPHPTEKILIKRNVSKEKDEVFVSYYEDKMKKEITSITYGGYMTKIVKFKMFRNPNELLFLQNIYYYRCVLETYFYYKKLNKVPDKKELSSVNMYYHEFIKNLF